MLFRLLPAAILASGVVLPQSRESALDQYVREAIQQPAVVTGGGATPGSLWSPAASLGDLATDLRAAHVDDIVTILVSERAVAAASGDTASTRKSSASSSLSSLLGPANARLSDLLNASTDRSLQGQGSTSRESTLTATLTARVVAVLPNGNLVVEGSKTTVINSERQWITVRGVLRPYDLTPGNVARSDRLAQLEVHINGRGVVDDAIRRPNFLYRLLLGLLPF